MGAEVSDSLTGKRVAIANRGEIAIRIAATCRRLGAIPILLIGEPDREGFAARQIGRVEVIGEAGSELDVSRVIVAAKRVQADFLHPGYGFLSERADLSSACEAAGILFVGPSPATLELCGDKIATRTAAGRAGAPLLPASGPLSDDPDQWKIAASEIGYPLLVKPAEAGGGRGLRFVAGEAELLDAVAASRREGAASGASEIVYLERALVAPRHVEVQVAGDGRRSIAVGDRDCSIQRRHQKVIEEAPAPNIDDQTRSAVHEHARRIADEVGLRGIATCEFLLGADGTLAFLEVNPRIQVEHPVTELVTGIDLVEWQLRIAAGQPQPDVAIESRGHAIEARVYAEDPANGFLPSAGRIAVADWPVRPDVRVDAGYTSGDVVSGTYDPLLAKIIARGATREAALDGLRTALRETVVAGIASNLTWLLDLLDHEATKAGAATTQTASEVAQSVPNHGLAIAAAVAHALDRSRQSTTDPWSAIGPLRLSGPATLTFHGDEWEERIGIQQSAGKWEIVRDDSAIPLRWWRDENQVWTIALGEEVARFAILETDEGTEVAGNGGRWLLRSGSRTTAETTRRQRASDGRVRAPLPAKVLSVHVAAGDYVKQNQPLVTLSAMKIELSCDAPAAGVVEVISCQAGELVDAGALLVQLNLEADSSDS
jgi:acetyl/propionyl-CoA carboxylase alpha subunit